MKTNKKWISLLTSASLLSAVVTLPTAIFAEEQSKVSEDGIQEKLPELLNKDISQSVLDQYQVVGKNIDDMGQTHYTLEQNIDGIPSEEGIVKVHTDKEGKIVAVTGDVSDKAISLDAKPSISEEEVTKIAKDHFKTESEVYQIKQLINSDDIPYWDVKLVATNPTEGSHEYKISAINGEILKETSGMKEVHTTTSKGLKHDGNVIDIPTVTDGSNYYLMDVSNNEALNIVFDYRMRNQSGEYKVVSSQNGEFQDSAAVDAYDHAKMVYNYYSNVFNYKGVDGKDAPIKSFVHFTDEQGNPEDNAFWSGDRMLYGTHKGVSYSAAKDIVGHETTHGVINNTSNLDYAFESGALNESLADTFGYFVDPSNWTMGEALGSEEILRDLSSPARFGQPEHMRDYVNVPESNDHGGVHTNSGIMNKAAYNVITAIGKEKAEQIFFQVMRNYLSSHSQFSDMRDAMVQATSSMYPDEHDTIIAVNNAYASVGIGTMIESVSNNDTDVESDYYVVPNDQIQILDFYDYAGFKETSNTEETTVVNS